MNLLGFFITSAIVVFFITFVMGTLQAATEADDEMFCELDK